MIVAQPENAARCAAVNLVPIPPLPRAVEIEPTNFCSSGLQADSSMISFASLLWRGSLSNNPS